MEGNLRELLAFCMNKGFLVCIVTENENVSAYNGTILGVDENQVHVEQQREGKKILRAILLKKITSVGIMFHR